MKLVGILLAVAASAETIQFVHLKSPAIEKRLAAYVGQNTDRERTLHNLFIEAGCSGDHLVEQTVKDSKTPNVICSLEGTLDSAIIVGAHFDYVNKGSGVIDNWSGASMLPSLFESLKTVPRRHNFVFIGFTDEEQGLVGSEFYVRRLDKKDLPGIHAMVNLDSLGSGTTRFERDRADPALTQALASVASTFKLPLSIVDFHLVGRSDADSFQKRKIPSINIHSIVQETLPILHSPRDQMGTVRMQDYYDSYRLIACYLAYLDVKLDSNTIK